MNFGRFSVFRSAKSTPNKFSYKSRFYDEKAEEMEKRKRRLDREIALAESDNTKAPSGSISFNRNQTNKAYRETVKRQVSISNMIVIGLIVILCAIGYYVLQTLIHTNG